MARKYDVAEEFQPLSPWSYFGLQILYSIPVLGFVFLLIHAIGAGNINKRNFAKSYFCVLILFLIVTGLVILIVFLTGGAVALGGWLSGLGGASA